MPHDMTRRDFLAASAVAAGLPWSVHLLRRGGMAATKLAPVRFAAQPFDLRQVKLRDGFVKDAQEVNRRHLLAQDPDRLLHMFRLTAGLPSTATPLGGWEAPDNELRGHYVGHWLSACSLMVASTGDDTLRSRGAYVVGELAKCQSANGNGYLSAFPETLFDRLRAGKPAWAPFYTLHKIMAGLLDTATRSGNAQALDVVRRMAGWTRGYVQPLGDDHMARILEREYGGMNDALYSLAAVTGDQGWAELARRFDHERFFAPLAEGRDELKGLHVNTNVPKVIGAARRYELTGDHRSHAIADYFWHEVTGHRCYATGGTSNGESWNAAPDVLSTELSAYTQECCVSYNMLKLTRQLFSWTADPRLADYYERVYYNGILGTQHPSDGDKLYYVPLAPGYWKLFGTPEHDYWCCTGTGAESFSKLGDSIYFHDDAGIFVNLFVASEVEWPERHVRLVQDTAFPTENTTRLAIRCDAPVRLALRVRVPYWAQGGSARLGGKPLETFATPGSYFVVDRVWRNGDTLEVTLPMRLHVHRMPDDPSVQAVMYGPLVLAGRLGNDGLTPATLRAEPTKPRTVPEYKGDPPPAPAFVAAGDDPASWVRTTGAKPLEFATVGQPRDVTLVPLYQILDERYGVYWKVSER